MTIHDLYLLLGLVLAAILGSFGNVLIHRLPLMILGDDPSHSEKINLSLPASHCPNCHTPLKWWHNFPLISYVLLKAHCYFCKIHIPTRYFWVELGSTVLALLCYLKWGVAWESVGYFLFLYCLWIVSWIDAQHYLIPDKISFPLIIIGLVFHLITHKLPIPQSLIGGLIGYGALRLIFEIHFRLTGRQGMGFGDMKLFAAIGVWLGGYALPHVLLIACVTAIVWVLLSRLIKPQLSVVPLGPFLSVGAAIVLFYPRIINTLLMTP